jgi:hypothetical protein
MPAMAPAPVRHVVTMKVFDAKSIASSPRMIATGGTPATFRTGDAKQMLALVVTPTGGKQFNIQGNLVQWTKTGLVSNDTSVAVTANGHAHCLTFWKRDPTTGEKRPVHVDVTIS